MVNLILSKYIITNQNAQTADVCKVMYVTLPINSDWIGDIQTVFSALLLMLQKLLSWENVPLQNLLQASYTVFIKKEWKLSQLRKYLRQISANVFS